MGTIREEIAELIREQPRSAREISKLMSIQEKEVYNHLLHIARSAARNEIFHVDPSRCIACGYIFHGRNRLTRPGRCPRCRGQRITKPSFFLDSIPS
ncbi:MAG: transcriptional regulator [Deltaproteobacteria bacterium]|nr:transcriptional regulator [Deltaproteobacteria bacterium]